MAIFSIRAIKGITINPEPKLDTISAKLSSRPVDVWLAFRVNEGTSKDGKPGGMSPISLNGAEADDWKTYPMAPQTMTRMAFREVPINHINLLIIRCFLDFSSSS